MHIPKTAGTTLIQIIEQQFNETEIARWLYPFHLIEASSEFFKQHRYFHGHVENTFMGRFLPQQPIKMTMLRHPLARYLSHFDNHQRVFFYQIPDITLDVYHQFQQTSLADFVQNPPQLLIPLAHYFQNLQAKFLASEYEAELAEGQIQLIKTGQYILPAPDFQQAKRQLDQFAFVGLTERFQDSLLLMAYTFGWLPVVEYKSLNIAPSRSRQDKLPPDLLEQINQLNRLDWLLYEYGQQLFEMRFEQMSQELLERYGRREYVHLKLPLPVEVMVELLDTHYRRRFAERYPAVSTLRLNFDQKISGHNWQVMEPHPIHGAFRWSGPGHCSTLDLPVAATSDVWLRFSVALAITAEVLASLVVKVNDAPIEVERHQLENGVTICEGYVSQAVLAGWPGCMRISFEVEKTVRPLEIIPDSQDDRLLGIALNWVEVEPAPPLEQEVLRLKRLVATQKEALICLKHQLETAEIERQQTAQQIQTCKEELALVKTVLQTCEAELALVKETLQTLDAQLQAIHNSKAWRILSRVRLA